VNATDIPVQSIPALARKRIKVLQTRHGFTRDMLVTSLGIQRDDLDALIAGKHRGNMFAEGVLAEANVLLDRQGTAHINPAPTVQETKTEQREGTSMDQPIKQRIKEYRHTHRLSWSEMDAIFNLKRMDVMVAPSAKITDERIMLIEEVISKGMPAQPAADVAPEPATSPAPVSTPAPENDTQPEPADEQHAVIEISHDMAVLEAAHDLIFDVLGIDLDELKRMAPTIDKLICAQRLGAQASLHIDCIEVSL